MANVRFVLKDRSRGLFRFLGLADSVQDFLVPMFCIRNANYGGYFDGTVKLVFTGQDGQPRTYEKSGAIATEDRCFVVKDAKFNFQKNAPLKIAGEIYDKNNHLVDKQEVNFLSLPLDNQWKSVISETQKNLESFGTNKIVIIGIVILLIVLILAVLLFFKRKQSTYE